MNLALPINAGWMLACRPSQRRFQASTTNVANAQATILRQMIRANQTCDYGRHCEFARIGDVDDFRERVPIAEYDDVQPWVEQICVGKSGVLTTEPVRLLEPTSGSVAARRLIPYTDSLRRQFQCGINPWISDLFSQRPRVRRGRAYWSVTPAIHEETTTGGLRIGFADDAEYLGSVGRWAASRVMAMPPQTMVGVTPSDSLLHTIRRLLVVPDLALISVWSPTFLIMLARTLEDSCDELAQQHASNRRVASVLRSDCSLSEKIARLWPRLALISCWADGCAKNFLPQVEELFDGVDLQPKGLISTEAFVSFPVIGHAGSALSVLSHFFEFQPTDSTSGQTLLAHELSLGERYRVIVTTGGGLYRYNTHDVVEVVGFCEQCPLIRFVGRDNQTSDLVGEKLNECFVSSAIDDMVRQLELQPKFSMLVPQRDPPGYRLLIELTGMIESHPDASQVATILDRHLSENPYYRHAIEVGQLAPLEVTIKTSSGDGFWTEYESRCMLAGMRRGDIKPTALETRFDWEISSLAPRI